MKRHAVSRLTLGIHLLALLGLSFIPIAVDAQNAHGAGQTRLLRTPTIRSDLRMQTTSGWLHDPVEARVD